MHNLHFVVVEAETGEDACSEAGSQIEDWGTENNWWVTCGAISAEGKTYKSPDGGRWEVEENMTVEEVKKTAAGWLFGTDDFMEKSFKKVIAKFTAGKEKMDSGDWYIIKKYAEEQGDCCWATMKLKGEPELTAENYDPFYKGYRSYKFDECGITVLCDEATPKEKRWIVFLDMHS